MVVALIAIILPLAGYRLIVLSIRPLWTKEQPIGSVQQGLDSASRHSQHVGSRRVEWLWHPVLFPSNHHPEAVPQTSSKTHGTHWRVPRLVDGVHVVGTNVEEMIKSHIIQRHIIRPTIQLVLMESDEAPMVNQVAYGQPLLEDVLEVLLWVLWTKQSGVNDLQMILVRLIKRGSIRIVPPWSSDTFLHPGEARTPNIGAGRVGFSINHDHIDAGGQLVGNTDGWFDDPIGLSARAYILILPVALSKSLLAWRYLIP